MVVNLEKPKLSICIATYNRAQFIGATLDSILGQMEQGVELVVVDGASPDNTSDVIANYLSLHYNLRYFREQTNSGVDCDYDKAVGYASGEYCWLMPDDDLLAPGAISRVLRLIDGMVDLIVVNSELWNVDISSNLKTRMLNFHKDRRYKEGDREEVFTELAGCLSYIGSVVIKRLTWLARDRLSYYGTLFVHVGVIFQQPPIERVSVVAEPLIIIRYGNGMWTPRGFEIWNFKWPQLIWSFPDFSEYAKQRIVRREPWRQSKVLFYNRAMGAYSISEFRKYLSNKSKGFACALSFTISIFPAKLLNLISVIYYLVMNKSVKTMLFDMLQSRNSTVASRLLASILGNRDLCPK